MPFINSLLCFFRRCLLKIKSERCLKQTEAAGIYPISGSLDSSPTQSTLTYYTLIIKIYVDWGSLYLDVLKAKTLLIPTAAPVTQQGWLEFPSTSPIFLLLHAQMTGGIFRHSLHHFPLGAVWGFCMTAGSVWSSCDWSSLAGSNMLR